MVQEADAVVVGAGPNGLVAAIALGDAGWDVVVVEAHDEVGGAVSSAEVLAPGYVTDLFSAFYPLAAASPVITGLDLPAHGLRWERAPDVVAHALTDAVLSVTGRQLQTTDRPDDGTDILDTPTPGPGRVRGAYADHVLTASPVTRVVDAVVRPGEVLLRAIRGRR